MADVDFPSFLRGPVKASKSRETGVAYRQNDPFSGPAYTERLSDDTPTIYDIEFAFESGYKRAFIAWFKDPAYCDKGIAEFNIDLEIESGIETQEARFTANGAPQLRREQGGVYFYTAQIIIRDLQTSDDIFTTEELLTLADITPCGNIESGMEQIDFAINEDYPGA